MTDPTITRITPTNIHLKKTEALEIAWADGRHAVYPLLFLRKNCPCAGCKGERDLLGRQLLPIVQSVATGPITATDGQLVGNYALRITFSDGHDTGIFSFRYLRELAEKLPPTSPPPPAPRV